jgi:hypothetical protein
MTLVVSSPSLASCSCESRMRLPPRERPTLREVSVVVPVRNNAHGVDRIRTWWSELGAVERSRELTVVDDGSRQHVRGVGLAIRVIRSHPRGPAAARNLG